MIKIYNNKRGEGEIYFKSVLFLVFSPSNKFLFADDKNVLSPEPRYAYVEVLIKLYQNFRYEEYLKKS